MPSLFDVEPKKDSRFLYGRSEELKEITGYIRGGDWVVLLGPRRVGKTSIAKCASSLIGFPSMIIDSRECGKLTDCLPEKLSRDAEMEVDGSIGIPHTPSTSPVPTGGRDSPSPSIPCFQGGSVSSSSWTRRIGSGTPGVPQSSLHISTIITTMSSHS